ncbi:MAG: TolC family protein [Rickettsiales bacterium]|jgi:outer membrane protein TolC|nr:TolC family protein [Rickettsiales bacterium]
MKKANFFAFFLTIFFIGVDTANARNLSLDTTVALVMEQSNDVKKAAANIEKMRAALNAAHSGRFPKIDATAAYQTNLFELPIQTSLQPGSTMPHMNIGTAGLSASMPIYTFGKIGYALDMARNGLKLAETSKRLAEIEIRAAAIHIYWAAKMTDEMVKIAERALKNTRSAQSKLTATGRANRSNIVKISADVAAREIDLEDAKFNRDSAFRMLKAYAGITEEEPVALTTEFPESFQSVKANRPSPLEWDIYEMQAKIHDAEKWQNYTGYLPTIAATAKYDYLAFSDRAGNLVDDPLMNTKAASVGVGLQWTLFDGGSKRAGATMGAMSAIMAREDLDKSKRFKTAEYNDLIQNHAHLIKQLKDLKTATDLAERAYKLSTARFLAGQTSATELSDVERSMSQMEMAVLTAKLKILTAAENIKKFEAGINK